MLLLLRGLYLCEKLIDDCVGFMRQKFINSDVFSWLERGEGEWSTSTRIEIVFIVDF